MAPRKNKNRINDGVECSTTASKRRRLEILNGTNGVPFTNPITEFPSMHLLQQQRNTSEQAAAADNNPFSPSMTQQNFLTNFHTNQTRLRVEELWRRDFAEEVKKRRAIEAKLKEKEETLNRFREMYQYNADRSLLLEDYLKRNGYSAAAAAAAVPEEEVQSSLADLNGVVSMMDMACKNCRCRPATMLWLPCRHLCVCLVCERRVKICPICSVKKTESFMINLPS